MSDITSSDIDLAGAYYSVRRDAKEVLVPITQLTGRELLLELSKAMAALDDVDAIIEDMEEGCVSTDNVRRVRARLDAWRFE